MTRAPSRPVPPVDADRLLPTPPFPPPRRPGDVRAAAARTWGRSWPWLLALAAVVLVVLGELGLLHGRIQADLSRLRDAAGVPSASAAAPARSLAPIPVVAPAGAGDVVGVRVRLLDPPCEPGSSCAVAVGVDRRPGTAVTPTAWTVMAADRCRGTEVPLGGGVTPGAAGAYGVVRIALPPGRALAVLAVTTAPSRAASTALAVGAGPC